MELRSDAKRKGEEDLFIPLGDEDVPEPGMVETPAAEELEVTQQFQLSVETLNLSDNSCGGSIEGAERKMDDVERNPATTEKESTTKRMGIEVSSKKTESSGDCEVNDRINCKPQCYDGSYSWSQYRPQFLRAFALNKWPKQLRVDYLIFLLDGEALSYVEGLKPTRKQTFEALDEAMEDRFGEHQGTQVYRAELRNRVMQDGETYPALAQDICRLTRLAYPGLDWEPRGELAMENFTRAIIDPDIRLALYQRNPQSIVEAGSIATDLAAWKRAEKVHQEEAEFRKNLKVNFGPTKICAVETTEPEGTRPNAGQRRRGPIRCYNCGKMGHIAKNCWEKQENLDQGNENLPQ